MTIENDEFVETVSRAILHSIIDEGRGIEQFRYANFSVARVKHAKKLKRPLLTIRSTKLKLIQNSYRKELRSAINQLIRVKISPLDAIERGRKAIRKYYTETYLLGLRASGLRINDLRFANRQDREYIDRIVGDEMIYWRKFVAQQGTGAMPVDRRIEMYVQGLESIYSTARVNGLPRKTLIFWDGANDERTCESCKYMFAKNPYTPRTLPTTPKAGMTLCMCLTNCYCNILTNHGIISLKDVVVGDYVFTHKNRWQRVLKKHENHSAPEHRYAVLVGEDGKLIGITSDHLVRVNNQWKPISEVAEEEKIKMYSLWQKIKYGQPIRSMSKLLDKTRMEEKKKQIKRSGKRIWNRAAQALRRYCVGFICIYKKRWQKIYSLLERRHVSVMLYLSLSMVMGTNLRRNTRWLCNSPQEWRPSRRQDSKFGCSAKKRAYTGTRKSMEGRFIQNLQVLWRRIQSSIIGKEVLLNSVQRQSGESKKSKMSSLRKDIQKAYKRNNEGTKTKSHRSFLLSELLQQAQTEGNEDPCVQLLRKEVQEKSIRNKKIEVGRVLLLSGTLPVGSPLYDLTVEDDHSFIIDGLTLHNSNCRDKLVVVSGAHFQFLIDAANKIPKSVHIAALKSILRRRGRVV